MKEARKIKYPMDIPNLTPHMAAERHITAVEIVEALEMQATEYRNRYRLPSDHRFTAVFPHNQQIGRDVFELAATALASRGIDVDWSMWPVEGEPRPEQKPEILLFPTGSFQSEPDGKIDLNPGA
jgi:hypothetical protein